MALHVIKRPLISERSLSLANSDNIYTFYVDTAANKHQIEQAVSLLYNVTVMRVRTITHQAQVRRTGKRRMLVKKPKTKKALVWLKSGETIEAFAVTGK